MWEIIFVFAATFIVFLFFWIVLHKKKRSDDLPVAYICDVCGDNHCDCHKVEKQ